MKYTLVLGIAYKKYKNPGDIAVYVGGRLIDAFQIDQDVAFVHQDTVTSLLDETWYSRLDRTRWLADLETNKNTNGTRITHEFVPKLFKIYEIEEQDLNGLVEIKVDNSHNDHTNGFMKNSSMIRFPMIGLFPNHFVENKGEQLMRIAKKIGSGLVRYKKRSVRNDHFDPKLAEWAKYGGGLVRYKKRSVRNDHFNPKLAHAWPCVGSFYTRRQNNMHENSKVLNKEWWVGGSFTAEIPIKTKHRIKYLSSIAHNETGFLNTSFEFLILATCKPLLNIYNENQRSNRTKD